MYGILFDFIYRLNSNTLFFTDDIAVPEKSLSLHTILIDLSLFSVLKEWRQFK